MVSRLWALNDPLVQRLRACGVSGERHQLNVDKSRCYCGGMGRPVTQEQEHWMFLHLELFCPKDAAAQQKKAYVIQVYLMFFYTTAGAAMLLKHLGLASFPIFKWTCLSSINVATQEDCHSILYLQRDGNPLNSRLRQGWARHSYAVVSISILDTVKNCTFVTDTR